MIKAQCPTCHAPIPLVAGSVATFVLRRTCRKCRRRWQLVVGPCRTVEIRGKAHTVNIVDIAEIVAG